jgi:hypothetical protein
MKTAFRFAESGDKTPCLVSTKSTTIPSGIGDGTVADMTTTGEAAADAVNTPEPGDPVTVPPAICVSEYWNIDPDAEESRILKELVETGDTPLESTIGLLLPPPGGDWFPV